jgi:hypothetical protein
MLIEWDFSNSLSFRHLDLAIFQIGLHQDLAQEFHIEYLDMIPIYTLILVALLV